MQPNYQKLIVWQKAVDLSIKIYSTTRTFPKEEIYGLTSQMRRSVVSIASNIAEGAGRSGNGEYLHFLSIARWSTNELETQIIIAQNLNFISDPEAMEIRGICQEILKILATLSAKYKTLP